MLIDEPAKVFVDHKIVERWRNFLTKNQFISEFDSITMLSDFGIITPRVASVTSLDELETALSVLNFPLVIKTAEAHLHKSDVGGVKLNIANQVRLAPHIRDER